MIDRLVEALPVFMSPLINWIFKDPFSLVSALGVLILVGVLIRVYYDERQEMIIKEGFKEAQRANIRMNEGLDDYAYIIVTNDERIPLDDCIVILVDSKINFRTADRTKQITTKYQQFSWSNRKIRDGDRSKIKINPGENSAARLDIAKAANGELHFAFNIKSESHKEIGLYYVSVIISGVRGDDHFENLPETFVLNFQGEDRLSFSRDKHE